MSERRKNEINVAELLEALKDCRPDAQVFVSLYSGSDLERIRLVENCGNYVKLVRITQ